MGNASKVTRKWFKTISEFNEDSIKNENSDERYVLEFDVQYPEDLINLYK